MALWKKLILGLTITPILLQGQAGWAQNNLEDQLRQPVNSSAISQSRDIADQLLRLGRQQAGDGQYEMAIRAWTRAAELYYDIGDRIGMGTAYENIGLAYSQLGDYDRAEVAIRRQLAVARDAQNYESQIFAGNALGTLQLQRGFIDSAVAAYEDALTVAQSVDNLSGIGQSLSNLGLVASIQGNYADAIKYYETAGNFRSRAGDTLGQANTNNNLGDVYLAQGTLGSAIGAYRLALVLGRELERAPVQLHAIDGLIAVYSARENWNQVRAYLDERIGIAEATGDAWQQLLTFKRLGEYYEGIEDYELAEASYLQAFELALSLEQKTLQAELSNRLQELARILDNA